MSIKNLTVWAGLNSLVFLGLYSFTSGCETSCSEPGLLALITILLCAPLSWLFVQPKAHSGEKLADTTQSQQKIPLAVYPMTGYICLGFLTLLTGKDNASHTNLFLTAIALLVVSLIAVLFDRSRSHKHKILQYPTDNTINGC